MSSDCPFKTAQYDTRSLMHYTCKHCGEKNIPNDVIICPIELCKHSKFCSGDPDTGEHHNPTECPNETDLPQVKAKLQPQAKEEEKLPIDQDLEFDDLE